MASDGIQISIPDFDDSDDFNAKPTFARTGAAGFWGVASGSGLDSPVVSTPTALERNERNYFHVRGDSVASEDSSHSAQLTTRRLRAPFAHSAQSSVATTSGTSFAKKSSFASLRNAFKSSKSADPAPPVPALDQQAYPALKDPFNRSNSSLAHAGGTPPSRSASHISPTQFRPATPASGESKFRGTPKSKGHSSARSQHSTSGSIFHFSDGGSDHGPSFPFSLSSSPPPVPRVPTAFGQSPTNGDPYISAELQEKNPSEPRSPSELALQAIFMRFTDQSGSLIEDYVNQALECDPRLDTIMGQGANSTLDEILDSFETIARKHPQKVMDLIWNWPKTQLQGFGSPRAPSMNPKASRSVDSVLAERRSLASLYMLCRALIAATRSMSNDCLPDLAGIKLEEFIFEHFKKPDIKMLTHSVNHRAIAELYAQLLGNVANFRLETVADRFLLELGSNSGQIPRDSDFKYENLVKGLKHLQIKVWPPESFEAGAEFLESLSKSFDHAHGVRLKSVFAETLVQILHPIAKTAQAEVNHPEWAKAIELTFPKARDMMSKPRYWQVAYPLVVTSLCVAPHEYFLRHWNSCLEVGMSKLKDKPYRMAVLNGTLRLLWTYLYRCHEPASTVTARLESLMKNFFPPNRLTIVPQEDRLDPFIYMVHFILSRHPDYGSELCLELLQERALNSVSTTSVQQLGPERFAIALQAVLLSIHLTEKEEGIPTWPTSADFTNPPSQTDYPTSSDTLSSPITRQILSDLLERCSKCVCAVATACYQSIGGMTILDDQWLSSHLSYEETHNFVIRQLPEGTFAYPQNLSPHVFALQTCFRSWPRCLHSTVVTEDALDILVRGVVHIEPAVSEAACLALKRFMAGSTYAETILSRLHAVLFDPQAVSGEGAGLRLTVESNRLLDLWLSLLEEWVDAVLQRPFGSLPQQDKASAIARIDEAEAGSLFLLSHHTRDIQRCGVRAMRKLGTLAVHTSSLLPTQDSPAPPFRVSEAFQGGIPAHIYLGRSEDMLDHDETLRLRYWRNFDKTDAALLIADSDNVHDQGLWKFVLPNVVQACMEHKLAASSAYRDMLKAAVSRYHPFILQIAGVRQSVGLSGKHGPSAKDHLVHKKAIQQWHIWFRVICATAQVPDSRPPLGPPGRDHSRARSEANVERTDLTSSRDLFRYLSQYLDSDSTAIRDTAVFCISSLPAYGYSYLLEDLSVLAARQIFDDTRVKPAPNSAPLIGRARRQERFQTAVARIYYLTAHLIQEQRSSSKQTALTHVLKYVRNMQATLGSPESQELFSMQRLRRYFCGTVERLFDGLATLNDSDRFIPAGMQLVLYRMCEEWCQLGRQADHVKKRLVIMQSAAAKSFQDPVRQAEAIQRFQTETRALSHAAAGAMASLVHKALFPLEIAGSPNLSDQAKPLESPAVVDKIIAIFASFHEDVQLCGRKALRSLLQHTPYNTLFADEVLRRAFVTTRDLATSNYRFFETIADVICNSQHGFNFSQVVCLGITNLCHPLAEVRRKAFHMLNTIHEQNAGIISLEQYEPAIHSFAPSTYLHAHRMVSVVLSGEHPDQALSVLVHFAEWIPRAFDKTPDKATLVLILLQCLEFWVPNIDLMLEDKSELSSVGRTSIYHLVSLTLLYAESHSEQISVLWSRLVDTPYQSNGHAIIHFLLDQSQKVGSTIFVNCAAKVVACLSHSVVGKQVFEELCSVIEPGRMPPSIDHKLAPPVDAEDIEMWSDLDVLFSEQPRLSLGVAQFSLLFLSDTVMYRSWEFYDQAPVLLHALFMHLDHRQPYVRERSRRMLFQLMRSCMLGYDEVTDRLLYPLRSTLTASIMEIERQAEANLWKEEDTAVQAELKMKWLVDHVIELLEPLHPNLVKSWGSLALEWGTACSIRPIAFRSLQFYRALAPKVIQHDLGLLLGRLANTIADEGSSIQEFNVEIILTLKAMATCDDLDPSLVPQTFWCALACLSTTVEMEFQYVLELMDAILDRIDLDDPLSSDALLSQQPLDWKGSTSIQSALLTGLRSSVTINQTLKLLQRLARVSNSRLVDPSEGRVRDLYTLCLPWCVQGMTDEVSDNSLVEFVTNIGQLADSEERPSIARVMTSFAKHRFRTKDDFLRQSVASLREHYRKDHWTEVVTLLVGLVLNKERWIRVHTLQILKVLFQQRETRAPMDLLGSELLMPLLRLLETDLAPRVLEVLEEPLQISGGPAAKHVLRMSLRHHLGTHRDEVEAVAVTFGVAQPSGWCVPRTSAARELCRANLGAVFDTCKVTHRPSRIDFHVEDAMPLGKQSLGNLGDLVQNLHELTTFFEDTRTPTTVPARQLEARVAAILAKSSDPTNDTPQTPLVDMFDYSFASYDDSESSSASESDSDLFEFDSPHTARVLPNGFHHG